MRVRPRELLARPRNVTDCCSRQDPQKIAKAPEFYRTIGILTRETRCDKNKNRKMKGNCFFGFWGLKLIA